MKVNKVRWLIRMIVRLYPKPVHGLLLAVKRRLYSEWVSLQFGSVGQGVSIGRLRDYVGLRNVTLGDGVGLGSDCYLSTWEQYRALRFNPRVAIGDGTWLGSGCHISIVGRLTIGANVLLGKYVTIVDNNHGTSELSSLREPPAARDLQFRGDITIGRNVWIGDKVTILGGVTIGEGAVVGANSVVTRDIAAFEVVAGAPARPIPTRPRNHQGN